MNIYLDDEQITKVYYDASFIPPQNKALIKLDKAIAKAAADYAVKQVVDWINSKPIFIQSTSLGIKVPIQVDREYELLEQLVNKEAQDANK